MNRKETYPKYSACVLEHLFIPCLCQVLGFNGGGGDTVYYGMLASLWTRVKNIVGRPAAYTEASTETDKEPARKRRRVDALDKAPPIFDKNPQGQILAPVVSPLNMTDEDLLDALMSVNIHNETLHVLYHLFDSVALGFLPKEFLEENHGLVTTVCSFMLKISAICQNQKTLANFCLLSSLSAVYRHKCPSNSGINGHIVSVLDNIVNPPQLIFRATKRSHRQEETSPTAHNLWRISETLDNRISDYTPYASSTRLEPNISENFARAAKNFCQAWTRKRGQLSMPVTANKSKTSNEANGSETSDDDDKLHMVDKRTKQEGKLRIRITNDEDRWICVLFAICGGLLKLFFEGGNYITHLFHDVFVNFLIDILEQTHDGTIFSQLVSMGMVPNVLVGQKYVARRAGHSYEPVYSFYPHGPELNLGYPYDTSPEWKFLSVHYANVFRQMSRAYLNSESLRRDPDGDDMSIYDDADGDRDIATTVVHPLRQAPKAIMVGRDIMVDEV